LNYLSPFFVFLVLPSLVVLHSLLSSRVKNLFLFLASLWVYSGGENSLLPLLLMSIVCNYWLAIIAGKLVLERRGAVKTWATVLNIGLLAFFKYLGWFGLDGQTSYAPLGISFFTFQALSYVYDVCNGEAKAKSSFLHVALYISLFPQLIAGPILRYRDVEEQLIGPRRLALSRFNLGGKRFLVGLAKKLLIADLIGYQVDRIFQIPLAELTPAVAWLGAIGFALQVYFDLSGYTDMAIGMGHFFGFKLVENFNFPLVSRSITEFWQRWHMSLTNWFRTYLYFPAGDAVSPPHWGKLLGVFLLVGLWHGPTLGFLLFGLINGLLILVEQNFLGKWLREHPRALGHLYFSGTFAFLAVLFRADNLKHALHFSFCMLGVGPETTLFPLKMFLDNQTLLLLILAVVAATPVWGLTKKLPQSAQTWLRPMCLAGLAAVCAAAVVGGSHKVFLYYQF
jgi:alginate O-acetyltransferase complex protein AlgI